MKDFPQAIKARPDNHGQKITNLPHVRCHPQKTWNQYLNFFSLPAKRLAESFEGLNSSISQLTGEFWSSKVVWKYGICKHINPAAKVLCAQGNKKIQKKTLLLMWCVCSFVKSFVNFCEKLLCMEIFHIVIKCTMFHAKLEWTMAYSWWVDCTSSTISFS